MNLKKFKRYLLVVAIFFSTAPNIMALTLGDSFVVDLPNLFAFIGPSKEMTTLSDGRFVVTWSEKTDNLTAPLYAQIFNQDGTKSGEKISVVDEPLNMSLDTSLASTDDGGFVITWVHKDYNTGPNPVLTVQAQAYDSNGTPASIQIIVASDPQGGFNINRPDVSSLSKGRFIVTWGVYTGNNTSSYDIHAQIFNIDGIPLDNNIDGIPLDNEFRVNSTTNSSQLYPTVTELSDGRFVIAWQHESESENSSNNKIIAQLFTADGDRIGDELLANSSIGYPLFNPRVTPLTNGRYLVSWHSYDESSTDFSDVRAQLFNADGTHDGLEKVLNTTVMGQQFDHDIVVLDDGRFVVIYQNDNDNSISIEDFRADIRAQVFNIDGSRSGTELILTMSEPYIFQYEFIATLLNDGSIILFYSHYDDREVTSKQEVRGRIFNIGTITEKPLLTSNPQPINFGNQPLRIKSDPQLVKITNVGDTDAHIGMLNLDGYNLSDFIIVETNCLGINLAPKEICSLSIEFLTSVSGERSASLILSDIDSNLLLSIPLSGTGVEVKKPAIVFLPGVGASRLWEDRGFWANENKLWYPDNLSSICHLKPQNDGTTSFTNDGVLQYTKPLQFGFFGGDGDSGPMMNVLTIDIYGEFVDFLEDLKEKEHITDFKVLPYDWRKNILDIASFDKDVKETGVIYGENGVEEEHFGLAQKIINFRNETGSPIILIGHSMGGLVAKPIIDQIKEKAISEGKDISYYIRQLVFIASPHLGTPKGMLTMLHGEGFMKEKWSYINGKYKTPIIVREASETMVGAYSLLPTQKLFDKLEGEIIIITQPTDNANELHTKLWTKYLNEEGNKSGISFRNSDGSNNHNDFRDFLLAKDGSRDEPSKETCVEALNHLYSESQFITKLSKNYTYPNKLIEQLFTNAKDFHDTYDGNWEPPQGLDIVQITGWGLPTLQTISYFSDKKGNLEHMLHSTVNGDKTVLNASSNLYTSKSYEINLNSYNEDIGGKHFTYNESKRCYIDPWLIDECIELPGKGIEYSSEEYGDVLSACERDPNDCDRAHATIMGVKVIHEIIKEQIIPDYEISSEIKEYIDNRGIISFLDATVRSPVELSVQDDDGGYTGPIQINGGSTIKIGLPNSGYQFISGHPYVYFGTNKSHTIKLDGYDFGTFTFIVREFQNDTQVAEINLENIPVTPQTKGKITLDHIQNASQLSLDFDGNGTSDIEIPIDGSGSDSYKTSIQVLISLVESFKLHHGIENSLISKLNSALNYYESGEIDLSKEKLNDLINQLNAKKDKAIPIEASNGLIVITTDLIALL